MELTINSDGILISENNNKTKTFYNWNNVSGVRGFERINNKTSQTEQIIQLLFGLGREKYKEIIFSDITKVNAKDITMDHAELYAHINIAKTTNLTQNHALNIATDATYTYIAEALPGTSTTTAAWRVKRIVTATGVTTWADGNANFDNLANSLTTLTYV